MIVSEKVARILLDTKAISLNSKKPFRYTSGIISPVYTDCRLLISFPKERKTIIDFFIKAIKKTYPAIDVIAGTSTAGIPWASWVADALNLPMIYVRGSTKDHGKKNQIEGIIKKEQKIVVIEDLISTAGSSIETVMAIRKNRAYVSYVFSIITYGMKKSEINFKKYNIKPVSLTNFHTILRIAQMQNYISKNDQNIIQAWTKDPASWGKKMGFEV